MISGLAVMVVLLCLTTVFKNMSNNAQVRHCCGGCCGRGDLGVHQKIVTAMTSSSSHESVRASEREDEFAEVRVLKTACGGLQGAIIISGVITLFDYKTAVFLAKVSFDTKAVVSWLASAST